MKSHILGMVMSRWNSVLDRNLLRTETSLAAQGLGHLALTVEGPGSILEGGNYVPTSLGACPPHKKEKFGRVKDDSMIIID